jgi:diadenosine tetraphosphate (Ap4A) HIT family hydrolase
MFPIRVLLGALLAAALPAAAQLACECDPAKPETMRQRACSLCNEAEKQPAGVPFFFLKDINPRKPTRWLALPRRHAPDKHHLHEMTKAERTAFWKAAMAKAIELWGPNDWGLAYNGSETRTQCHGHIHIGKFAPATENDRKVITVDRPEQIPAPPGEGVWVHPYKGRLHVHLGEQITETVLVR